MRGYSITSVGESGAADDVSALWVAVGRGVSLDIRDDSDVTDGSIVPMVAA